MLVSEGYGLLSSEAISVACFQSALELEILAYRAMTAWGEKCPFIPPDVAPSFYPVLSSFPAVVLPCWRLSDGGWRGAVGVAQRERPSRDEDAGKFVQCLPGNPGVRSGGVIVSAPQGGRHAGLGQRCEQRLVEQFIPQAAVEALDEAVLHRLAGRDVVPLDLVLISPGEN